MVMTHTQAERVARGLSQLQRMLLTGTFLGRSYRSYRTVGAALVKKGILRECLGGFFEATPLGLAVRAILQSQGTRP